jgi:hypothetical protein
MTMIRIETQITPDVLGRFYWKVFRVLPDGMKVTLKDGFADRPYHALDDAYDASQEYR